MHRRTAKQRANDKRLGQMAKKRHTVKRKRAVSKSMPRRKSRRTRGGRIRHSARTFSRRAGKGIGSLRNKATSGFVGDVVKARGLGQIVKDITQRIAPQYAPIGELAGQYLGGGVKGLAGAQIEMVATGQPNIIQGGISQITNLFGGGGQNSGGGTL